ncbi:MAG: hypothetical protein HON90_09760, partial [Halobacteriovoraceae bacterium]|nr:hypothetical protein [Halobacteriovoraceae bacterium]
EKLKSEALEISREAHEVAKSQEAENERLKNKADELNVKINDAHSEFNQLEKRNNEFTEILFESEQKFKSDEISNQEKLESLINQRESIDHDLKLSRQQKEELITDIQTKEDKIRSSVAELELLEQNVKEFKTKEEEAKTSLDKHEQRVDKLYHDKENLLTEAKKLNSSIQSAQDLHDNLTSTCEGIEKSIVEKEEYLKEIEQTAKSHYEIEKVKLESQLAQERQQVEQKIENFKNEQMQSIEQFKNEKENEAENLLESTKKKVEKLEHEASELFRLSEAKELEAKEYERKIIAEVESQKEIVNEKLLKKLHSANLEAKEIKDNAIVEYEQVLVEAKKVAQELASKTQEDIKTKLEAVEIQISQAHTDGISVLKQEKVSLENQITQASKDLTTEKQSYARLKNELISLSDGIEEKRKNFEAEMQENHKAEIAKSKMQAQEIEMRASHILTQAQEDVEKLKASKLKETKTAVEEMMSKEKHMIGKIRTQEMEKINLKKEEAEQEFEKRKLEYVETISIGIENLVKMKLSESVNSKLTSTQIKLEAEKIRYLVKASLVDKNPENNQMLKKLNPYGSSGIGNSNLFMKKVLIAIFTCLFIGLSWYFFSDNIKSVANKALPANSAKELYLKDLKEKESRKPKFSPRKSDSFKKSITENVLYTKGFDQIWLSDKFQKEWTIKVEEIIIFKLRIKDYSVVQYVTEELKLTRTLLGMSKKIKFNKQKEQIAEMKLFESNYEKKLIKVLGGKTNYNRMYSFKKKFFIKFKQKFK